jgi:hypothetical protein
MASGHRPLEPAAVLAVRRIGHGRDHVVGERLAGGHHESGEVDHVALVEPREFLIVESEATTHHGEGIGADVLHLGRYLEQLRVGVDDLDR